MTNYENMGASSEEVDSLLKEVGKTAPTKVVRHTYRVLSDLEKAQVATIKDAGPALISAIDAVRGQSAARAPHIDDDYMLNIADQRVQESVMWAVKHITT